MATTKIRLFHVSEDPNIEIFEPLPAPNADAGLEGNAVWAIDEKHLANYLLPRNCPRITYGIGEKTTEHDRKRFSLESSFKGRVVIVEDEWLSKISKAEIFLYEFFPENFQIWDKGAGYYISRDTEKVFQKSKISDLLSALKDQGAEILSLPNLWETIDEVASSSLEFSIIRSRFALPRPK